MASFWRRLFPETLFPRRLDEGAERRMRLAQARAEEAVTDAHVRNALMFIDTLSEDMPFDRAIDTYIRVLGVPEPLASVVATRVLVELGEDLMPVRAPRPRVVLAPEEDGNGAGTASPEGRNDGAREPFAGDAVPRPALRLSDSRAEESR
jgi:hypothetical protein